MHHRRPRPKHMYHRAWITPSSPSHADRLKPNQGSTNTATKGVDGKVYSTPARLRLHRPREQPRLQSNQRHDTEALVSRIKPCCSTHGISHTHVTRLRTIDVTFDRCILVAIPSLLTVHPPCLPSTPPCARVPLPPLPSNLCPQSNSGSPTSSPQNHLNSGIPRHITLVTPTQHPIKLTHTVTSHCSNGELHYYWHPSPNDFVARPTGV